MICMLQSATILLDALFMKYNNNNKDNKDNKKY